MRSVRANSQRLPTREPRALRRLSLRVGAREPDGYHPLATVFQAVSLYDEVTAEWAPPDDFSVTVGGTTVWTDDVESGSDGWTSEQGTFTDTSGAGAPPSTVTASSTGRSAGTP